ncbi:HupE/UreJ family protein [Microbulbifer sp. ZKSA002]|uniref:HupE/UreJ family protein n=1 Tax=Microbulbifer sp. ZKSA002 TaxID=3243388 RepID=UPI0040392F9C
MHIRPLLFILLLSFTPILSSHELRPAYLGITQVDAQLFKVLWRLPAQGDLRLALNVHLNQAASPLSQPRAQISKGYYTKHWTIHHPRELQQLSIHIDGLQSTMTDALVRISWLDGREQVIRLTPDQPEWTLDQPTSEFQVAQTYFVLGVEHILLGVDHLLFVLALILLKQSLRQLIGTITAFTIAHSITLAAAVLGYIHLPSAPVEAIIALSILLAAREAVRQGHGVFSLTSRYPWAIAFAFGLLHGLGFAGVLGEIGLPQGAIPQALLTFNFGVEVGQLIFITAVLTAINLYQKLLKLWLGYAIRNREQYSFGEGGGIGIPVATVVAYTLGGIACYWVIERSLLIVFP